MLKVMTGYSVLHFFFFCLHQPPKATVLFGSAVTLCLTWNWTSRPIYACDGRTGKFYRIIRPKLDWIRLVDFAKQNWGEDLQTGMEIKLEAIITRTSD